MSPVRHKTREDLIHKLELWEPLSRRDRVALVRCLHMIDRLQTDLKLASSDLEGRIRDNNFLLITAMARKAEVLRLKSKLPSPSIM